MARISPAAAITVLIALLLLSATAARAGEAGISVVGGHRTTIGQHPWQVAVLFSPAYVREHARNPASVTTPQRQFCGGALVAPTIVVTAAHCVLNLDVTRARDVTGIRPKDITVLAGRTNLGAEGTGTEIGVRAVHIRKTARGGFYYLSHRGWDVALIELKSALGQTPIKLPGPDESRLTRPGAPLELTGWGSVDARGKRYPAVLRAGSSNIQPNSVCNRVSAQNLSVRTDFCMGDAALRAGSCHGDSGGPITGSLASEPRLVGIVSRGTERICTGRSPQIHTSLGTNAIRNWVVSVVRPITGVDPVGNGVSTGPRARLIRAPAVRGRAPWKARRVLRRAGFGKLRVTRVVSRIRRRGRPGKPRAAANYLVPGWLARPGVGYILKVRVQKRSKR